MQIILFQGLIQGKGRATGCFFYQRVREDRKEFREMTRAAHSFFGGQVDELRLEQNIIQTNRHFQLYFSIKRCIFCKNSKETRTRQLSLFVDAVGFLLGQL